MGRILGSVICPGWLVSVKHSDEFRGMELTCRIPLMAMTAQFYFGKRAWLLWGKKTWIKWFFIIVPTVTMMCGVAYVFSSARSSLRCANESVLR